jgi:hypothetical protein
VGGEEYQPFAHCENVMEREPRLVRSSDRTTRSAADQLTRPRGGELKRFARHRLFSSLSAITTMAELLDLATRYVSPDLTGFTQTQSWVDEVLAADAR